MREPIKAGDECIVVSGASGPQHCANRGRRVLVLRLSGPGHSRFGTMWRCRTVDGQPLRRIDGTFVEEGSVPANEADFAADWLQKADAPPPKAQGVKREVVA